MGKETWPQVEQKPLLEKQKEVVLSFYSAKTREDLVGALYGILAYMEAEDERQGAGRLSFIRDAYQDLNHYLESNDDSEDEDAPSLRDLMEAGDAFLKKMRITPIELINRKTRQRS